MHSLNYRRYQFQILIAQIEDFIKISRSNLFNFPRNKLSKSFARTKKALFDAKFETLFFCWYFWKKWQQLSRRLASLGSMGAQPRAPLKKYDSAVMIRAGFLWGPQFGPQNAKTRQTPNYTSNRCSYSQFGCVWWLLLFPKLCNKNSTCKTSHCHHSNLTHILTQYFDEEKCIHIYVYCIYISECCIQEKTAYITYAMKSNPRECVSLLKLQWLV